MNAPELDLTTEQYVTLSSALRRSLKRAVERSETFPTLPFLWDSELDDARSALRLIGWTEDELQREEAECERVWAAGREAVRRDRAGVTELELEALR